MQENVVFCVFFRLHWYRDLEPKNGRFEAMGASGESEERRAGNERERDRVREREREIPDFQKRERKRCGLVA